MALYREQGIVLRTHKLGEADRILSVLTPGRGKVRAVAKGVRRPSSRMGGRLEPYSHADLQLYEGRNLDIVTQAQLITSFSEIRADYDRSTCAAGVAEAADRIAQESERSNRLFLLVLEALRRLAAAPSGSEHGRTPQVVLDAYVLRLASAAGYHPIMAACALCGRAYTPATVAGHRAQTRVAFHIAAGGLVCSSCRPPDSQGVSTGTVAVLAALSSDPDWGAGAAAAATARERRAATALARSFFTYHIGRPLRAWELVPT